MSDPPAMFSTSKTWISLHPPPPPVIWHKAVWFPQKIPKHSFIVWIVLKDRMLTRDRLRSWDLLVPQECLLCGHAAETTKHLFFECQFSIAVWRLILFRLGITYPTTLDDIVPWLTSVPLRKKARAILKLVFQASVYFIWRERNSRLHSGPQKPTLVIVKEIHLQVRAKLLGLDREKPPNGSVPSRAQESYLSTWFSKFQPWDSLASFKYFCFTGFFWVSKYSLFLPF